MGYIELRKEVKFLRNLCIVGMFIILITWVWFPQTVQIIETHKERMGQCRNTISGLEKQLYITGELNTRVTKIEEILSPEFQ